MTCRRRYGLAIALLAATSSLLSPGAIATVTMRAPFGRCVREAAHIFAGTVRSMASERREKDVVTRVVFDRLRVVAGIPRSDSLVLVLSGGTSEGSTLYTVGALKFEEGRRYVVLAKLDLGSAANRYAPLKCFNQGFFPVLRDTMRGIDVMHDHSFRPIARMDQERPIFVSLTERDHDTRMSEEEFLKALQQMRASAIPMPRIGPD